MCRACNVVMPMLGMGFVGIGVVCSFLFAREDPRHCRACRVLLLGAVVLLADYFLLHSPACRFEEELALGVLGCALVFLHHLRKA